MKYPVYAIQDVKVGFYPPETAQTEGQMVRNFAMMVNSPSTPAGFSPADFMLYHVADFDTQKGCVLPVIPISLVASGANLVGVKDEK